MHYIVVYQLYLNDVFVNLLLQVINQPCQGNFNYVFVVQRLYKNSLKIPKG